MKILIIAIAGFLEEVLGLSHTKLWICIALSLIAAVIVHIVAQPTSLPVLVPAIIIGIGALAGFAWEHHHSRRLK